MAEEAKRLKRLKRPKGPKGPKGRKGRKRIQTASPATNVKSFGGIFDLRLCAKIRGRIQQRISVNLRKLAAKFN